MQRVLGWLETGPAVCGHRRPVSGPRGWRCPDEEGGRVKPGALTRRFGEFVRRCPSSFLIGPDWPCSSVFASEGTAAERGLLQDHLCSVLLRELPPVRAFISLPGWEGLHPWGTSASPGAGCSPLAPGRPWWRSDQVQGSASFSLALAGPSLSVVPGVAWPSPLPSSFPKVLHFSGGEEGWR